MLISSTRFGAVSRMPECGECGANWGAGAYTEGCTTCGGGAIERGCPVCGGICGKIWRKSVVDTLDRREAHWAGQCGLISSDGGERNSAPLQDAEWWLDESALPDLIWAALFDKGSAVIVRDCDGKSHFFPDRAGALLWLGDEEYVRLADLQKTGEIAHDVKVPASLE
jgi:hypothetical protein